MLGSFRDPAGQVFLHRGAVHRLVRPGFAADYDALIASGLYRDAVERGLLIAHEEIDPAEVATSEPVHRLLRPVQVPFVSYPYEWCFAALRDAALLTLELARLAARAGLRLKDASAYNVQFFGSQPVFIDTLSFERAPDAGAWPAYYQFCRHFLAPLALASRGDTEVGRELRVHLDGLPLRLASERLPRSTWLRPGLLAHLHLHAASERPAVARRAQRSQRAPQVSANGQLALLDHLEGVIRRLPTPMGETTWRDYEQSVSPASAAHKAELVNAALDELQPTTVWDLGANAGRYSRLASGRDIPTVALDVDPRAVELAYERARTGRDRHLISLRMDLTNPSPALGWRCEERMSLLQRGPCDLALCLALIHHLALGEGIPLGELARGLRSLAQALLIEWVPPSDPQALGLLARRPGAAGAYTQQEFEAAFGREYAIASRVRVRDTERTIYLLRAKP